MSDKKNIPASAWKPGQSGNLKGRTKGSSNKITNITRAKVNTLLENNWQTIQSDLERLEPKDRLDFICKMMGYVLPKLQMIRAETSITSTGAEELSDTELTQFIFEIARRNKNNNGPDETPLPI